MHFLTEMKLDLHWIKLKSTSFKNPQKITIIYYCKTKTYCTLQIVDACLVRTHVCTYVRMKGYLQRKDESTTLLLIYHSQAAVKRLEKQQTKVANKSRLILTTNPLELSNSFHFKHGGRRRSYRHRFRCNSLSIKHLYFYIYGYFINQVRCIHSPYYNIF